MRRGVALTLSCWILCFSSVDSLDAQDSRDAGIVLEPVVTSGSPRTYQVISIPVPQTVPADSTVVADIIALGGFSILGTTRKVFGPSGAARKVVLTIVVPPRARAGLARAAEIHFQVGGNPDVTIPIDIHVAAVRKLSLRTSTTAIVTLPGGVASVPFTLVNDGNVAETLRMTVAVPREWHLPNVRKTGIIVESGRTLETRVQIKIPESSATGSAFLAMEIHDSIGTRSTAQIPLEILEAGLPSAGAGPQVVAAVSSVAGLGRGDVGDLAVKGPLFDSVRIDGRIAYTSTRTTFANQAFSRLGIYQGVSYLVLSSPSSVLQLGAAGLSLSELTGKYLYGQGAVFETSRNRWSFAAIAASSVRAISDRGAQPLLGARAEVQAGIARVFSSISHLIGGENSERRLDAFGVGASVPLLYGGSMSAEVARREFIGGHGYGWTTSFERTVDRNSARLAYSHAPGGADAFARSSDEITASISQQLTHRASISAAAWRVSDPTQVFSAVRSDGWSMRPEYMLLPSMTVAVEASAYGFDAVHRNPSITATSFGTREQRLGVSMSSSVGPVHFNGSTALGEVTRVVTTQSRGRIEDRTPKIVWTGAATVGGERGSLQLHANVDETRDKTGAVHRVGTVGVRADRVRAPLPFGAVRISAEAQTLTGYQHKGEVLLRGSLDMPAGAGFRLKLGAERNPSLGVASNAGSWTYIARIERALRVPMLRAPGTTGFVYQDLNGNDRRDRGEPGVASAIVRRGSVTAVTEKNGRYRLAGDRKEIPQLDDGSIPDGWILTSAGGPDFGLTAAAVASIEMIVAPGPALRDAHIDLAPTRIVARDARGREWTARMSGPTTATFDALPPADYELEFDLSGIAERLTVRGATPRLHLASHMRVAVTVTLEPRQLKLWTPDAKSAARFKQ